MSRLPSVRGLAFFKDLKSTTTTSDDCVKSSSSNNNNNKRIIPPDDDDHDRHKRIRTFSNVRNQFVIHIYCRLPLLMKSQPASNKDNDNDDFDFENDIDDDDDDDDVNTDVDDVNEELEEFFEDIYENCFVQNSSTSSSIITPHHRPHISLIRGHYAVQYHQIEPLLNDLIKLFQRDTTVPFTVWLNKVDMFHNDERTRSFVVLCEVDDYEENEDDKNDLKIQNTTTYHHCQRIYQRKSSPITLVNRIHHLLTQYRASIRKQPKNSDNESQSQPESSSSSLSFRFHTSIASFVTLPKQNTKSQIEMIGEQMMQNIRTRFQHKISSSAGGIPVRVNKVYIKIGHRKVVCHLGSCSSPSSLTSKSNLNTG